VRDLATRHGVVLIFDEVVTGFRLSLGGAQELFGVTPDMATFAKAISNGYPFGAVVGKRKIMSRANDMFVSSTYWSDPITATAALTTVREYRRRKVQDYIWQMGKTYMAAFNELAAKWEVPARFEGMSCNFGLNWHMDDPLKAKQMGTYWVQECNKRGIFPAPGAHMSWAHREEDLGELKPRWNEVLELVKDALIKDDLPQRLETELGKEAFRRLVR
jgi:glutamate-1-semialdehyde aminotransferase